MMKSQFYGNNNLKQLIYKMLNNYKLNTLAIWNQGCGLIDSHEIHKNFSTLIYIILMYIMNKRVQQN